MSEIRSDDRTWVEAVDHYVAGVRRERPRRSPNGRYVLASALVLAVTMSPVAIGATGSVLREGKRNPSSGAAAKETEMISQTKTYGTRQSNIRDGNGGGAIYGCRSSAGREPCIRANNLKNGAHSSSRPTATRRASSRRRVPARGRSRPTRRESRRA